MDRVPVSKAFRQVPPLAATIGDIQDGVQHTQIGQADVAALKGQAVPDLGKLGLCDFHAHQWPAAANLN